MHHDAKHFVSTFIRANQETGAAMVADTRARDEEVLIEAERRMEVAPTTTATKLLELLALHGQRGRIAMLPAFEKGAEAIRCALPLLAVEGTPVTQELLRPLLRHEGSNLAELALGVAGFVALGDASLDDEVGAFLETKWKKTAYLTVGRRRATQFTELLLDVLDDDAVDKKTWEHAAAGLELMQDSACIDRVKKLLLDRSKGHFELIQVLKAAYKVQPFVDVDDNWNLTRARKYRAYLGEEPSKTFVAHEVVNGCSRLRIQGTEQLALSCPLPSTAQESWLRWGTALCIDSKPLFHTGSVCSTCESFFQLTHHPRPQWAADRVGDALAGVKAADADTATQVSSVLERLPSSTASFLLLDLPLERVSGADSWFARRAEYRRFDDPDDAEWYEGVDASGIADEHHQLTSLLCEEPPTFLTVLPSQELRLLDEKTVEAKMERIRQGTHPATFVCGYLDEKFVCSGHWLEVLVPMFVIDGHHTMEAYRRLGLPARVLCVLPWLWSGAEGAKRLEALLGEYSVSNEADPQ